MKTTYLPIQSVCQKCGQLHIGIPLDAEITSNGDLLDGAYFNCCQSTIFVPAQKIADAIKKLARLNAEIAQEVA